MKTLNEWRESVLDGTKGYDVPLTPEAESAIKEIEQICRHYFQTLGQDPQILDQIVQQFGKMVMMTAAQRRGA